jgi:hypothetical protein
VSCLDIFRYGSPTGPAPAANAAQAQKFRYVGQTTYRVLELITRQIVV